MVPDLARLTPLWHVQPSPPAERKEGTMPLSSPSSALPFWPGIGLSSAHRACLLVQGLAPRRQNVSRCQQAAAVPVISDQ